MIIERLQYCKEQNCNVWSYQKFGMSPRMLRANALSAKPILLEVRKVEGAILVDPDRINAIIVPILERACRRVDRS